MPVAQGRAAVWVRGTRHANVSTDALASGLLRALCRVLDGRYTTDEIADLLAVDGFAGRDVRQALGLLYKWGLVAELDPPGGQDAVSCQLLPQLAHFSTFSSHPAEAQNNIGKATVGIVGMEWAVAFVESLSRAGVSKFVAVGQEAITHEHAFQYGGNYIGERVSVALSRELSATDLILGFTALGTEGTLSKEQLQVLTDADLIVLIEPAYCEHAATVNSFCLDHRIPLMRLWVDGEVTRVGPLIIPFETACFTCRQSLQDGLDAVPAPQSAEQDPPRRLPHGLIPLIDLGGRVAAGYAAEFLSRTSLPPVVGAELELDLAAGRMRRHQVPKDPYCPDCGRLERWPRETLVEYP